MSAIPEIFATAVKHHQAGQLAEAERLYKQILDVNPDHADVLHLLGVMAAQAGKPDVAIDLIRRAIRLAPGTAAYCYNLGKALESQGELDEAVTSYKQALQIQPDHAEAHNNLGNALEGLGKLDEAVASYQRAVEINPDFAQAQYNLGNAFQGVGKLAEAVTCYQRAVQIQPDYARALSNLGVALHGLGRLDEAVLAYQRAVQIQPDHAGTYANLAQVRSYTSADKDEIERIEALLNGGELNDSQRCDLHFALGKIYDDCQDWNRAFTNYREGNALVEVTYDNEQTTAGVDAMMTHCTPTLLQKGSELGDPSELPVLIVGMPRSGTTLVEQILASHPAVHGAGELPHIAGIAKDLPQEVDPALGYPACLSKLNQPIARKFAAHYLEQLKNERQGVIRVTDKMPSNFLHLGLVAMLLPNARIIHCRRHPLDVCLSCYYRNFTTQTGLSYKNLTTQTGLSYTFDLRTLGLYYKQYVRLMDHWRQVLPLRMLEVDYEDLVDSQEDISRTLVEFCGLEWDSKCLEFHKTERDVRTASAWQVRQPIYSTSVGRWKHYDEYLEPLKDALGWSCQSQGVLQ